MGSFSIICGQQLSVFEYFLIDCGFDVNIKNFSYPKSNIKYFWLGGLIESLFKYGQIMFHTDDSHINSYGDSFKNEFKYFLSNDVYLREDTKNIFTKEMLDLIRRN